MMAKCKGMISMVGNLNDLQRTIDRLFDEDWLVVRLLDDL